MNVLSLFVLLNFLLSPSQQANTYKDFKVQRSIDCQPENETYPVKVSEMKIVNANGSIFLSGKIEVLEDLPMKIDMEFQLTRCNLDSTGCVLFSKAVFARLCDKIEVKTSLTYKITRGIHPTLTCPIKKNSYDMMNDSSFNMDMFKSLPLEGFLWRSRYMFYEKNGSKRVRTLVCVESDVAFMNKTRRPKPKN